MVTKSQSTQGILLTSCGLHEGDLLEKTLFDEQEMYIWRIESSFRA